MTKNPARKYWNAESHPGITNESVFMDRRRIIKGMAATAGAGLLGGPFSSANAAIELTEEDLEFNIPRHPLSEKLYPAKLNEKYKDAGRVLTEKEETYTYNNFYEFSLKKDPRRYVSDFEPFPWAVEIRGLCNKPKKWDFDEMLKAFPLEERVYRFRCVEAWAMTVPWTGFPLADLIKSCDPKSEAKYVRFVSFNRPEQARGQKFYTDYQWPYFEGLHLEEAMNPLSFVATGSYGKHLPKQSGSPLRIILPWKYGYKGPKSIVTIELTDKQPDTFWNLAYPAAYGFYSNVNPEKPHPNWSQAQERYLGEPETKKYPTQLYNGYADEVAKLHSGIYKNGDVL